MRIGKLRHLVTLQTNTPSVSTSGEVVNSWSDGDSIYADIATSSGSETATGTIKAENKVKITIRHYPNLTNKHRIKFGSRYFDIIAINNIDQRGLYNVLDCEEVI